MSVLSFWILHPVYTLIFTACSRPCTPYYILYPSHLVALTTEPYTVVGDVVVVVFATLWHCGMSHHSCDLGVGIP